MKCKKWTTEENETLVNNYQLKKQELLKLFPDRTPQAINIQASKLGLKKEHNEYCESDTSILLLDTLETYYWIGFILADGHISNLNRLIVDLQIRDLAHLKKLSKYISCKNIKIYPKRNTEHCRLSTQDKLYLKQVKEKFDIKSDKTYYPPNLHLITDKNLFLSLLIGYIDGDGCIKYQTGRKDVMISFHIHSSWLCFLQLVKNRLISYFGLESGNPIIGNDGYARYNIGNYSIIKQLKSFAVNNHLPVLNRKWDKIDENRPLSTKCLDNRMYSLPPQEYL